MRCSHCNKKCSAKKDGTIRKHDHPVQIHGEWREEVCPGSNKKPKGR